MSRLGPQPEGPGPDARAVEAANAELYAAFEEGDLDRMEELWVGGPFADSAVCVHPGSPPLRGREEVLRSWTLLMANFPYVQVVLTDVDVSVAGDVAVVTCAENTLAGEGDREISFDYGGRVAVTNVFRRTEEGWRLWIHHGSPVLSDP
ncbi:MAG: nuclear transport factor 2 family protein [Streptosporangiaceae bacterium]